MATRSTSLPGDLGSAKILIAKLEKLGYKSKEIDSGVQKWETSTDDEIPETAKEERIRHMVRLTSILPPDVLGIFLGLPAFWTTDFTPVLPLPMDEDGPSIDFFRTELEEAQIHYPAEHCVLGGQVSAPRFHSLPPHSLTRMSSLNNKVDPTALNIAVLDTFSKYGEVYGAVYYDNRGPVTKPYAILQYTVSDSIVPTPRQHH